MYYNIIHPQIQYKLTPKHSNPPGVQDPATWLLAMPPGHKRSLISMVFEGSANHCINLIDI